MNYLLWFCSDLSIWLRVPMIIALLAVNFIFAWFVARQGKRIFQKTGSSEEALDWIRKAFQYIKMLVLAITMFPVVILVYVPLAVSRKEQEPWELYLFIILLLLAIYLIGIVQQRIVYRTLQEIRGLTEPFKNQRGMIVRSLFVLFSPPVLLVLIIWALPHDFADYLWERRVIQVVFFTVYIVLYHLMNPILMKFVLKTVPLENQAVYERIHFLFKRAGLQEGEILIWPTSGIKLANAMASGLFRYKLCLTDYMLDHLTLDEVEAVVAHELGHIKRGHLWIRLILSVLWLPIVFLVQNFYNQGILEISPIIFGLFLFAIILLYLRVMLRFLARIQERQADHYVLELGIEPSFLISALCKIMRLNHGKMSKGKLDEKFQTHPSMIRRIRWLMKAGGVTEERLNEIQVSINSMNSL